MNELDHLKDNCLNCTIPSKKIDTIYKVLIFYKKMLTYLYKCITLYLTPKFLTIESIEGDIMRNSISSIERTTTVASVVEKLRRKIILNGYIKGVSLTEVELATSYGVSRGSIRSALQVLEGEGLVETLPNGRKIVIGLSEKDIHDLYRVRAILESEAVKTILECPYLNYAPLANDVHEFEELLKEDDEDALIKKRIRINIRFHRTLMEMCGNRSLIRCWIQQQSLAETLAEINSEVLQVKSHHEEYIQKHQEILRLLILKSPTAVDYIKEHIEEDALQVTLSGIRNQKWGE